MTDERPATVGHQAPSAQDVAGVPALFGWRDYSPAEGIQKANG
jgi:hypothetical protein